MPTPTNFIYHEVLTIEAVDADGTVRLLGANGLRQIKVKDPGLKIQFSEKIGKRINFGPAIDFLP